MNSSDYALQAVKGIKKSFDNAMTNKLKQYMDNRIIAFYVTDEESEIFTSTEGLTGSRKLGQEETPDSLALQDGYSVTITEERFGGAIVLPENVVKRAGNDPTTKVRQHLQRQRNQLLMNNVNLLLYNAFNMLNNAHNSGADELAPDGVELCGAHTWASGSTFDNSATAALDADAVDDMDQYAGEFTDPTDTTRPWVHNFSDIIVKTGSANARMAIKLFAKDIKPISVADINIYFGQKTIIETPYITATNTNYWFGHDPMYENSVAVGIGIMPTLNEPIKQNNEAVRSNCTGFWKQGVVNMPHDWYSADGTT